MKKLLLIPLMICAVLIAMDKPPKQGKALNKAFNKEITQIIDSYHELLPAIARIKQILKVPVYEAYYENPVSMDQLIRSIADRFPVSGALIALLLGIPNAQQWIHIKIAQEKQKNLALKQNIQTQTERELQKAIYDLFEMFWRDDEKKLMEVFHNNGSVINILMNEHTPLMRAAEYNLIDLSQQLIAQGAHINAVNHKKETALIIAIRNRVAPKRQKEVVRGLLSAGADPNICDSRGYCPLAIAAEHNYDDIMRLLLDAGARVDLQNKNGNTALMSVLSDAGARDETIILLLDYGSNMNIANKKGETALSLAIKRLERPDIVRELLNRGAPITDAAVEAAHNLPSSENKEKIIKSLEEKQANPQRIFSILYKKIL